MLMADIESEVERAKMKGIEPRTGLRRPCCHGWCTLCAGLTCILVAIILLAAMPITLFTATPPILSTVLQNAKVEVHEMVVTAFSVDNDPSLLNVRMAATVGAGLPVATHVAAATVSMNYNGKAFMDVPFPSMSIAAGAGALVNVSSATAVVTDTATFTDFSTALLTTASVNVELHGHLDLTILGCLSFSAVPMATPITLKGVNGFAAAPPQVLSYDVVSTTADSLSLTATVSMTNPSPVGFVSLGAMSLDVYFPSSGSRVPLGQALAADAKMLPLAENLLACTMTITRTAQNAHAISAVLSDAMNAKSTTLTMQGTQNSTSIVLMQGAIAALSASTVMRPLPQMPMLRIGYNVIPTNALAMPHNTSICPTSAGIAQIDGLYVDANVALVNPLSVPLTVHTMDMAGYWETDLAECPMVNDYIASCTSSFPATNVTLPLKLFESPPALVDYGFEVPAGSLGTVLDAQLCYPQMMVANFACALTGVLLACFEHGYHIDMTGRVPIEIFATVIGSATATVGNFSTSTTAPLTIDRGHMPLLMRTPCDTTLTSSC